MVARSYFRGYEIEFVDGTWVFVDTGKSTVSTGAERPCGHCDKDPNPEGHDACLGTLPGVMNACCGHGKVDEAYVQFWDRARLAGQEAIDFFHRVGVR